MKTIDELLFDGASSNGRAKVRRLMNEKGWVMPLFEGAHRMEGVGIGHRVSWEWIQNYITGWKGRVVGHMREAPIGADHADEADRMAIVSSVEMAVTRIQNALKSDVAGYVEINGFDLDIFIRVTDLVTNTATVTIEVFPRKESGAHSTAIASGLGSKFPYVAAETRAGEQMLEAFVFAEGLQLGRDRGELESEWREWKGPWRIRSEAGINAFLSECMQSFLIANGVKSGFAELAVFRSNSTGSPTEAVLTRDVSFQG